MDIILKFTNIERSLLLFSVHHFRLQKDTDIWSVLTQLFNGYQNFLYTLLDILDSFWRKQLFRVFCIEYCHNYWFSIP